MDLNIKQVLYKSVNDESIGRAVNKKGAITEHSLYHLAHWTHSYKMCFNTVPAKNARPTNRREDCLLENNNSKKELL